MGCSVCATISDEVSANIGRDEHFGEPITSLRTLFARSNFGGGEALAQCPECGALFHSRWDVALTGSGNNDSETLRRVPAADATRIAPLLQQRASASGLAELARAKPSLSAPLSELLAGYIDQQEQALAIPPVPQMLDSVERGAPTWLRHLDALARNAARAASVEAALAGRPQAPALDELRATCKRTLCSICRAIPAHGFTVRRSDPPREVGALARLGGGDDLDLSECPECAQMYSWQSLSTEEGRLVRLMEHEAAAVRACIHHRGAIADRHRTTLFASKQPAPLAKIVLCHGRERDRTIVRLLLREALAELASDPEPWLVELLHEIARDPRDAALTFDAIEAAALDGPAVQALKARCWTAIQPAPPARLGDRPLVAIEDCRACCAVEQIMSADSVHARRGGVGLDELGAVRDRLHGSVARVRALQQCPVCGTVYWRVEQDDEDLDALLLDESSSSHDLERVTATVARELASELPAEERHEALRTIAANEAVQLASLHARLRDGRFPTRDILVHVVESLAHAWLVGGGSDRIFDELLAHPKPLVRAEAARSLFRQWTRWDLKPKTVSTGSDGVVSSLLRERARRLLREREGAAAKLMSALVGIWRAPPVPTSRCLRVGGAVLVERSDTHALVARTLRDAAERLLPIDDAGVECLVALLPKHASNAHRALVTLAERNVEERARIEERLAELHRSSEDPHVKSLSRQLDVIAKRQDGRS